LGGSESRKVPSVSSERKSRKREEQLITKQINLFRVAFLLERMCPLAYGLGSKFNETYFGFFNDAINYITVTKGAYAILDPHNYMRYNDPSQQPATGSVIGNTTDPKAATTAQFGEFWQELAGRYKNNSKVIFGIMNEPHDMPTSLVLEDDQAAINGIRASGAKNLIIAPGNGYTGGHAWTTSSQGDDPSSEWMYKITDPLNNTAFDIHEYLDSDFSGGHLNCSSPAPTYLAPLTAWLKEYGFKAMITEFGAANGTECRPYIDGIINYMAQNEEYIGWTAWAAGPIWGTSSPCCTSGANYGSLEPYSLASDGSPG
jgi:endoglucanase